MQLTATPVGGAAPAGATANFRSGPSLARGPRAAPLTVCKAKAKKAKGFGATQTATKKAAEQEKADKKKLKRVRSKGKTSFRQGGATSSQDLALRAQKAKEYGMLPEEEEESKESMAEQMAFEERLATLSETGALMAKEKAVNEAAALDPMRDIYASPPTIGATAVAAFDQGKGQKPPVTSEEGPSGPNRVALTVGAVILAAIVGFSSGDYGPAPPAKRAEDTPTGEARKQLSKAAGELEGKYKADSSDTESLEGAAVTYAQLGEYKKAERLLETLSKAKPEDKDVWRLLAETRMADDNAKKAVDAYSEALKVAGGPIADIDIFKGYTSALVKDGKASRAVEEAQAAVTAAEAAGVAANTATPYEMQLLLGKVYSGWSGHNRDAVAVYDSLIKAYPEDFRAYLTKGLLLREMGQKGDAERMFLQARFFAPKEARNVVDRIIAQ